MAISLVTLTQNFNRVFEALKQKKNISTIAKSMGYTTSAQLHSVSKGESLISTKAIMALVENAKVNPAFLFLGEGDIFLSDEPEVEKLKKENQELIQRIKEAEETNSGLRDTIQKLEKRNEEMFEIYTAAIKYHKGKKDEEPKSKGKELNQE